MKLRNAIICTLLLFAVMMAVPIYLERYAIGQAIVQTGMRLMGATSGNVAEIDANQMLYTNPGELNFTTDSVTVVPSLGIAGLTIPATYISAASDNATNVKNAAGNLFAIQITNTSGAIRRVKFYDKGSAPTCGTDTPKLVFEVPFSTSNVGGHDIDIPSGISFANGIGFCMVTGQANSDDTSVGAGDLVLNLEYK